MRQTHIHPIILPWCSHSAIKRVSKLFNDKNIPQSEHCLSCLLFIFAAFECATSLMTNKRTCNKVRLCFRSKLYVFIWIECKHFSQGTTLPPLRNERSLYAYRK
jgi:hypothetical protein